MWLHTISTLTTQPRLPNPYQLEIQQIYTLLFLEKTLQYLGTSGCQQPARALKKLFQKNFIAFRKALSYQSLKEYFGYKNISTFHLIIVESISFSMRGNRGEKTSHSFAPASFCFHTMLEIAKNVNKKIHLAKYTDFKTIYLCEDTKFAWTKC